MSDGCGVTPADNRMAYAAMLAAPRWMVWRAEPDPSDPAHIRKVPYYANGKPRGATDTPEDWKRLASYEKARDVLERGGYTGLGFALGPDGNGGHWQGVDFDDIETNCNADLANERRGYVERSPSLKGSHVIGYGADFQALSSNGTGIEAYAHGRFFTVTEQMIFDGALVDLAPWVLGTLAPRHATPGFSTELSHQTPEGSKFVKGGRNDGLSRVAYGLRKKGVDISTIHAVLQALNAGMCVPPLADNELWDIAKGKRLINSDLEDSAAEPFPFKLASDIGEIRDAPYVIRKVFERGKLVVLYGAPGAGKSFIAVHIGAHIVQGKTWLVYPTRRTAVLFVAAEGAIGIERRYRAAELAGIVTENAPFAIISAHVRLTEDDAARIIATVRALQQATGCDDVLVIFDTLARVMVGNENSTEDMSAAVRCVDQVRTAIDGVTVLLVHHSGKDASLGARGSTALKGAIDTELEVTRKGDRRVLSDRKQRDLEQIGELASLTLDQVQVGIDPEGQPIMSAVVRALKSEAELSASGNATAEVLLKGKTHRQLLAEVRKRSKRHPQRVWTEKDVRDAAKATGMAPNSITKAVPNLIGSVYMQAVNGGYLFVDSQEQAS